MTRNRTTALLALIVGALIMATLLTLMTFGSANRPTDRTVRVATPVKVTATVVVNRPPYWHTDAPSWCQEDMVCWIGSNADSRTDREALADWRYQMRHVSAVNH